MLELLRQVDEQSKRDNPHQGQRLLPKIRADLAALSDAPADLPKRWLFNMLLGKHLLRLGHEQEALEHYLEARRQLEQSPEAVPQEHYVRTMFELGVAYMRWGETQNCVEHHNAESCIFPIGAGGVHGFPDGSRNAAGCFTEVLRLAKPGSPERLRAQWLLNIAAMTLGEYPDGVPEAYRIPAERFASGEPFPRFADAAGRAGLKRRDLAGGAVADDFDGDGLLDLMLTSVDTQGQLRLYINDGDGTFSDRTESAGLTGLWGGLNLIHGDYDGDGDIDALVLRGGWWRKFGRHPKSLLRNNGDGTFTDVTFEAGLAEVHYPTQTAAWADYDLDGDLDLYVGNESGQGIKLDDNDAEVEAPCQLFRNNGDGTFTDVAAQAGVQNLRYAKGVVWGDFDGDRYPDIYVSNCGHLNRLYRNRGDGTFVDVAPALGVTRPISSFPTWFWDVNNDGWLDIFVGAYGGPRLPPDVASVAASYLGLTAEGTELDTLYLADGKGGFRDVSREWSVARVTLSMGANFGDLDNDGFADFYLGTGYPYYEGLIPNVMYHNRRGQGFADVTSAGGFGHLQKGHGVAFADLDNDGDQDVFERVGGAFPGDGYANVLFENPGFGNHWIKIRLVGKRSNRWGVGSRIRADVVEQGTRRSIYDWVSTGGSFGGSPLRQELGLGRAERVERLEVYWPASDTTQSFRDVPADRLIEIVEGETSYRTVPLPRLRPQAP